MPTSIRNGTPIRGISPRTLFVEIPPFSTLEIFANFVRPQIKI